MPAHYSLWVQVLSMAAFTLAFVGWLNETWLFWFDNPIWLNRYTEYGIILGFGIWRIIAEKNAYTRKRLIILVGMVTVFWWLVPWLYPVYEPYVGFLWSQPVFPSVHVPGTITFFLILAAVFFLAGASSVVLTAPVLVSARRLVFLSVTAPCVQNGPGRCVTANGFSSVIMSASWWQPSFHRIHGR